MLCFSSARTLFDIRGSEKSGFLGSVHDMSLKKGKVDDVSGHLCEHEF